MVTFPICRLLVSFFDPEVWISRFVKYNLGGVEFIHAIRNRQLHLKIIAFSAAFTTESLEELKQLSVDATLVDDWSQDAAMPTKFDEFTPQAMMGYTGRDPLVKQHLTLLQLAMAHNNFYGLRVEWWHFTTADWKKYVPYWEDKQMSQTGDAPAPKS